MKLSVRTHNGILLLRRSLAYMWTSKRLLIAVSISIFLNFGIFFAFFYLEYRMYGVHVFDLSTFDLLGDATLSLHINNLIAIFILLLLSACITSFFQIAFVCDLLRKFENKPLSILKSLGTTILKIKRVIVFGLVLTMNFFEYLINTIDLRRHCIALRNWLLGLPQLERHPNGAMYFLAPPLIVKNNYTVAEGYKESYRLMNEKFGKYMRRNYSYNTIKIVVIAISLLFSTLIFLRFTNAIAMIVLSLLFIVPVFTVIDAAAMVFKVALYNYCTQGPLGPFTEADIDILIIKDDE